MEKEWQKCLYWSISYVINPNIYETFKSLNRNKKVPCTKFLSISNNFRLKNGILHFLIQLRYNSSPVQISSSAVWFSLPQIHLLSNLCTQIFHYCSCLSQIHKTEVLIPKISLIIQDRFISFSPSPLRNLWNQLEGQGK